MEEDYMLTTYDNPFNPFTEFTAWWKWDMRMGYDTCGTLAREAATSELFSDELNDKITVEAMDYLCSAWPLTFKKVTKADYPIKTPSVAQI